MLSSSAFLSFVNRDISVVNKAIFSSNKRLLFPY